MKLPGVLKIRPEDEDDEQQTSLLQSKKNNPKQPAMNLDLLNEYHPLHAILCYV